MNIYLDLFLTFAKIGAFTFGGGYAMLALIENACVERKQWITSEEMMNVTVIAESTPGPVAINCATFVGYKQKGLLGAICATLGMVLPSFLIILLISYFLDGFLEIPIVANAFLGIKVGVGLLIVNAALKMMKKMKKTPLSVALLVGAFGVMTYANFASVHISSILLLLVAGVIALSVFAISDAKSRKGGLDK